MNMVDVRDFGAVGDGTTDDTAAFITADQAAQGRELLISKGTYRIGQDVNLTDFETQLREALPENSQRSVGGAPHPGEDPPF